MNKIKTFVIGDIHGAYKALIQCFERAQFDYNHDRLICLGDVCDGWPEINKSFDELLKISNLIYTIGNHDAWALDWTETGEKPYIWLSQGGKATLNCYTDGMSDKHVQILKNALNYYVEDNILFVHGGIYTDLPLEEQDQNVFIWDRSLVDQALYFKSREIERPLSQFSEIFLGHTPTLNYDSEKPIKACEVWMMDTGAGWYGKLSMMNIDTKELFQSDPVPELYPDHPGRW